MRNIVEEKLWLYKVQTAQDTEAFAKLYDRYVERIYRFVFFKLSHEQDAQDVTSDVFLKCWHHLSGEQGKGVLNFGSFAYTVARNCVVDVYRKRATRNECSLQILPDVGDSGEGAHLLEQNQNTAKMVEMIKKLKREYQEVLLLRYVEDLPIREISLITGKSSASVRVTLHRATKKLEEILKKHE